LSYIKNVRHKLPDFNAKNARPKQLLADTQTPRGCCGAAEIALQRSMAICLNH
jgi:hypothetical protein